MDILFLSRKIFLGEPEEFIHGGILVTDDGKIRKILRSPEEVNSFMYAAQADEIIDFEDKIIMPGLIDANVNLSEPGRKDWEGFVTGTKAAAAGGFTTIVDMPINSIPPTTTIDNLKTKITVARGKIFIDVAFWGGIVPENSIDDLLGLIRNGVVGFKCFLCSSGIEEFRHVDRERCEFVMEKLKNLAAPTVIAFHGELEPFESIKTDESEPKKYLSYLNTRPPSMELKGIELISNLAKKYKIRIHINNLCNSEAIPIIQECRQNGGQITVETCHHYLSLDSKNIPDGRTEFKCIPPIRDKKNQKLLWEAIVNNDIDLVVSNHSPSTPGMKCLTYGRGRGDFLKACSGIGSIQFGLSIFWTFCTSHGMTIKDVYRLMCRNPAELCNLYDIKGKIIEGYDADFCIWDPDEEFIVSPDIIYFQNKATPYLNMKLRGVVYATVVRGLHVYQRYEHFGQPLGKVILKRTSKKIVKFT